MRRLYLVSKYYFMTGTLSSNNQLPQTALIEISNTFLLFNKKVWRHISCPIKTYSFGLSVGQVSTQILQNVKLFLLNVVQMQDIASRVYIIITRKSTLTIFKSWTYLKNIFKTKKAYTLVYTFYIFVQT